MLHLIEDALMDSVKLIPFLFLTYLVMEYLEHRTGEHARKLIRRPGAAEDTGHSPRRHFAAGLAAPIVGGLLGALPQCGFSAAASNLYAGRVITLGTLMAVYLSTSDEMLPILISQRAPVGMILKILAGKALVGMAAGLVIDLAATGREDESPTASMTSASRSAATARKASCAPPCPIRRRSRSSSWR